MSFLCVYDRENKTNKAKLLKAKFSVRYTYSILILLCIVCRQIHVFYYILLLHLYL